ncbi:NAD(P)H-dependent oxidoreductase [Acinetobacter baumannii]|nr:NAD(P)H-dependent oxidoreductase [Acinetobacter baumannii]ANC35357.1 hypothetical protein Aba3207_01440 [Acinetobacter baumannii]AXX40230.1 hypothetical protein Aba9201_03995 [Acinetobacter baumannii]EKT8001741.1 NAD(P)H-dependent oxidoreductase [Acinetobacter baumannii]EKU1731183.1 NAD(P)H-dependent oxidoreductase [Acinetobacter baumannii]EKV2311997.1 NAD(P)H-dependent oxidoreductase [Acinetobacter baumannii]
MPSGAWLCQTRNHSRTYQLVDQIMQEAAKKFNFTSSIYNLANLGHSFLIAQSPDDLDIKAKTIIQHIVDADILIIGVPTWNAGYPGRFKHLFDLIAPDALIGKPIILSATGGSERHTLMIDYQLRPLLNYYRTIPVSTSIYATSNDEIEGYTTSFLKERIQRAIEELEKLVPYST